MYLSIILLLLYVSSTKDVIIGIFLRTLNPLGLGPLLPSLRKSSIRAGLRFQVHNQSRSTMPVEFEKPQHLYSRLRSADLRHGQNHLSFR